MLRAELRKIYAGYSSCRYAINLEYRYTCLFSLNCNEINFAFNVQSATLTRMALNLYFKVKYWSRQYSEIACDYPATGFMVLSRVDYCNSLFANAPATSTKRIQSLINVAARVMSDRSRFEHITECTSDHLHWPPIRQRVDFKICSLVYQAQHDLSPIYITEMMKPTSMILRRQDLRSATRSELMIPKHRTTFTQHAFMVAGRMAWIRLPQTIREAPSFTTFRRLLTKYLFEIAYSDS